jgi:hypothetical protein
MVNPTTGRSKTALSSNGVRQRVDLDEVGPLDSLNHELSQPVATSELDRTDRIQVDHDHLDLASIPGVDRPRSVDQCHATPCREPGPGVDERGVTKGQRDRRARGDDRPLPRSELNVNRSHQIRPGIAVVGVRRRRQVGIQSLQQDLEPFVIGRHRAAPYRAGRPAEYAGRVPTYDERLRVPWTWWPVLGAIVVFGALEVGSGFSYVVLVPVAIFLFGFFIVPLLISGRERVLLRDGVLRAGKVELPVMQMTSVVALTREETRLRLGPQADPAAHLVVRGWVGPSVMIRLVNPNPVPYWVVSSRRPDELASAIKQSRNEIRAAR